MNCKPGDLAIVIGGSDFHSDALGRIVRVEHWIIDPPHEGWVIEFIGRRPMSVIGSRQCCSEDRFLRPITGLPVGEETRDEVTA